MCDCIEEIDSQSGGFDLSIEVSDRGVLFCPNCGMILRVRVTETYHRDVRYNPETGRVQLLPQCRTIPGPSSKRVLVCDCGFAADTGTKMIQLVPYKSHPETKEG